MNGDVLSRMLREAREEGQELALMGAIGALNAAANWLEQHPTDDPASYLRGVVDRLRKGPT